MSQSRIDELERIASEYHLNDSVPDKFIEDLCQKYCCDWLKSRLSPNERVVELGYGDGVTLSTLAPAVKDYSVVEGAPSLVASIKARFPEVSVMRELFEDHIPERPYDKILALHVFEHVNDPVTLAKHLRSWLTPSGELIAVVPNKASLHRRLAVLMGLSDELGSLSPRDILVGHQRVYDLAGLLADLEAAGFECIESKGFFLKMLPNSMMLTYQPSLINALNLLGEQFPAEMLANLAVRCRVRQN